MEQYKTFYNFNFLWKSIFIDKIQLLSHFFENHSIFSKNYLSQSLSIISINGCEIFINTHNIFYSTFCGKLENMLFINNTSTNQQYFKNKRCNFHKINRSNNVLIMGTLNGIIHNFLKKTIIGISLSFVLLWQFPGYFRKLSQVARSSCRFLFGDDQVLKALQITMEKMRAIKIGGIIQGGVYSQDAYSQDIYSRGFDSGIVRNYSRYLISYYERNRVIFSDTKNNLNKQLIVFNTITASVNVYPISTLRQRKRSSPVGGGDESASCAGLHQKIQKVTPVCMRILSITLGLAMFVYYITIYPNSSGSTSDFKYLNYLGLRDSWFVFQDSLVNFSIISLQILVPYVNNITNKLSKCINVINIFK